MNLKKRQFEIEWIIDYNKKYKQQNLSIAQKDIKKSTDLRLMLDEDFEKYDKNIKKLKEKS